MTREEPAELQTSRAHYVNDVTHQGTCVVCARVLLFLMRNWTGFIPGTGTVGHCEMSFPHRVLLELLLTWPTGIGAGRTNTNADFRQRGCLT